LRRRSRVVDDGDLRDEAKESLHDDAESSRRHR